MCNYLKINLPNLLKNLHIICKKVLPQCVVAPVLKYNAYGLGITEIAKFLAQHTYQDFWVLNLDEALVLRNILPSSNIYILQGILRTSDLPIIQHFKLIPVINNIKNFYTVMNKVKRIVIHFDTGIGRDGLQLNNISNIIHNISPSHIMISHLSSANITNSNLNYKQLHKFIKLKQIFPNNIYSLANSGGTLFGKKYHFDMVRVGGFMYGVNIKHSSDMVNNVVQYYAYIYDRKILSKKTALGYNATYYANKGDKIFCINVGYANGFTCPLSNKYWAIYKNIKLPFIGKTSMNLITLCANQLPTGIFLKIKYVELIGKNNNINKVANIANIDPRQILTSFSNMKNRIYVNK